MGTFFSILKETKSLYGSDLQENIEKEEVYSFN
jgi:hypothetical protein